MEHYENFDVSNITTPVNAVKLHQLLTDTSYDPVKTRFLVKGFTEGFDLGYRGPQMSERSQNTILLASTLTVYKAAHSTVRERGRENQRWTQVRHMHTGRSVDP